MSRTDDVMKPLPIVLIMLLVNTNAIEILAPAPPKTLQDLLSYKVEPSIVNIRKREVPNGKKLSNEDFMHFVEKKLSQHTRALEHLLEVAQNNEDLTKKLIDNFSKYVPEPRMPDKLEASRRSFGGEPALEPGDQTPQELSRWCQVAAVCRRQATSVCGYDDTFGYGRFDDICHMLQVNCYWKYNFSVVVHCKPVLS